MADGFHQSLNEWMDGWMGLWPDYLQTNSQSPVPPCQATKRAKHEEANSATKVFQKQTDQSTSIHSQLPEPRPSSLSPSFVDVAGVGLAEIEKSGGPIYLSRQPQTNVLA